MCDGGLVSVPVITALIGAYGAYAAGEAADGAAQYNAAVAEQNATRAIQIGEREEAEQRRRAAGIMSRQRVQLAASGAVIDSGSPALLLEDTAALAELDALMIQNNTALEAWGIRSGAAISRFQGTTARNLGYFQAGSSLVTGGVRAAGGYTNRRNEQRAYQDYVESQPDFVGPRRN